EVGAFLSDIGSIQQDPSWQLFLEPKTPSLLIRCVLAHARNWSNGSKPNIIECALGVTWWGRDATRERRGEQAGCILQSIPWRGMINVESAQPRGLDVKSLESPRASSCSAASRGREIDAVAASKHEAVGKLIGDAEARLN